MNNNKTKLRNRIIIGIVFGLVIGFLTMVLQGGFSQENIKIGAITSLISIIFGAIFLPYFIKVNSLKNK